MLEFRKYSSGSYLDKVEKIFVIFCFLRLWNYVLLFYAENRIFIECCQMYKKV